MGILKDDIHKLIDTTKDKKLLEGIFMILSGRNDYHEGELWANLSEEQKKSVLDSEKEIGESSAWISHEEMKVKNKKWLR
jgi:hypothetical protein